MLAQRPPRNIIRRSKAAPFRLLLFCTRVYPKVAAHILGMGGLPFFFSSSNLSWAGRNIIPWRGADVVELAAEMRAAKGQKSPIGGKQHHLWAGINIIRWWDATSFMGRMQHHSLVGSDIIRWWEATSFMGGMKHRSFLMHFFRAPAFWVGKGITRGWEATSFLGGSQHHSWVGNSIIHGRGSASFMGGIQHHS